MRLQLQLKHHFAAISGRALVGYIGWLATTSAIADDWLANKGMLTPVTDESADVRALTIVAARDPAVLRALIRGARDGNSGRRIYFKRGANARNPAERKASVLNAS